MTVFENTRQVREANRALGHHWFDADTLRFFRSKFSDRVFGGRYFWSSEQENDEAPRLYTLRKANEDGSIGTVGEFQQYKSLAEVRRAIDELVAADTRDFYGLV